MLESQFMNQQDVLWQSFVAQQVGELIAQAPYLIEPLNRESVADAINKCIDAVSKGNAKTFASEMYLSLTVKRDWRIGKALPQLNKLLRVCYRLSISLLDIYLGNLEIDSSISLKELPLSEQYSQTNRSFDVDKVRGFLELHRESSPPQSLKQLAFKIGYEES